MADWKNCNSDYTPANKNWILGGHLVKANKTLAGKGFQSENGFFLNSFSHYYSYGSVMPGRVYAGGAKYKYKFNGKETDDETYEGCVAFEYRIFDARMGRFLSVDLWSNKYSWQSVYAYFANCPTRIIDLLGLGTIAPPDEFTFQNNQIESNPNKSNDNDISKNKSSNQTIPIYHDNADNWWRNLRWQLKMTIKYGKSKDNWCNDADPQVGDKHAKRPNMIIIWKGFKRYQYRPKAYSCDKPSGTGSGTPPATTTTGAGGTPPVPCTTAPQVFTFSDLAYAGGFVPPLNFNATINPLPATCPAGTTGTLTISYHNNLATVGGLWSDMIPNSLQITDAAGNVLVNLPMALMPAGAAPLNIVIPGVAPGQILQVVVNTGMLGPLFFLDRFTVSLTFTIP